MNLKLIFTMIPRIDVPIGSFGLFWQKISSRLRGMTKFRSRSRSPEPAAAPDPDPAVDPAPDPLTPVLACKNAYKRHRRSSRLRQMRANLIYDCPLTVIHQLKGSSRVL